MKVRELIDILFAYDGEAEVVVKGYESGITFGDVADVEDEGDFVILFVDEDDE